MQQQEENRTGVVMPIVFLVLFIFLAYVVGKNFSRIIEFSFGIEPPKVHAQREAGVNALPVVTTGDVALAEAITGLQEQVETLSAKVEELGAESPETSTQAVSNQEAASTVITVDAPQVANARIISSEVIQEGSAPSTGQQFSAEGGSFWIDGGVETATNIEQAKGQFVNKLGLGTQSWLADPGKLLINGFDFDLEAMKSSGGAIDHWNPLNQAVFETMGPSYWNLNEGGFTLAVGNRMTIRVPDRVTVHVEGDDTTAWIVIMRGLYSDFQTPSDRNLNLEVSEYIPGNNMFARYSGTPNGGYVSEGQFGQIADTTQATWNNCGQSGCPDLYALFYDANTGAWLVLHRSSPDALWERVATNMDYLQ